MKNTSNLALGLTTREALGFLGFFAGFPSALINVMSYDNNCFRRGLEKQISKGSCPCSLEDTACHNNPYALIASWGIAILLQYHAILEVGTLTVFDRAWDALQ
jgi:hypothetical protein